MSTIQHTIIDHSILVTIIITIAVVLAYRYIHLLPYLVCSIRDFILYTVLPITQSDDILYGTLYIFINSLSLIRQAVCYITITNYL